MALERILRVSIPPTMNSEENSIENRIAASSKFSKWEGNFKWGCHFINDICCTEVPEKWKSEKRVEDGKTSNLGLYKNKIYFIFVLTPWAMRNAQERYKWVVLKSGLRSVIEASGAEKMNFFGFLEKSACWATSEHMRFWCLWGVFNFLLYPQSMSVIFWKKKKKRKEGKYFFGFFDMKDWEID